MDDEVMTLLAAWRADVDSEPFPSMVVLAACLVLLEEVVPPGSLA